MRILPFRKAETVQPRFFSQDWTQQELAEFYRAHRLLTQNGVAIGLDVGISDQGDPWMVFFTLGTQDVFLHVARLEGRCVLVCDTLDLTLTTATIAELIISFELETRRYFQLQSEKTGNVLLHPAARLIMSISAIFLLFKLENGEAQAKGMPGEMVPGLDASRSKVEASGALARASQAMARLFDTVDAPAAAAALAGAILTFEIARAALPHGETGIPAQTAFAPDHAVDADGSAIVAAVESQASQPADPLVAAVAAQAQAEAAAAVTAEKLVAIELQLAAAEQAQAEAAEPAQPAAFDQAQATNTRVLQAEKAVVASGAAQPTVAALAADTQVADAGDTDSLAMKAVQTLIDKVAGAQVDFSPEDAAITLASVPKALDTSEISMATLDLLGGVAGFVFESAFSNAVVTQKVVEIFGLAESFGVEVAHGSALIEQAFDGKMAVEDLGIWTNTMADGSEITVVGTVDMVTSLTASLTA